MKLTTYTSAFDFLARTEDTYRHAEAANGLIYGLAKMLEAAPDYYGAPPVLATVADGDELIASCLRTPPYALVLQSTHPPDVDPRTKTALGLLAEHCRDTGADLSGVNGRSEISARFAALWSDLTGAPRRCSGPCVFLSSRRSPGRACRRDVYGRQSRTTYRWSRTGFGPFMPRRWVKMQTSRPCRPQENARRRIDAGVIQLWENDAPCLDGSGRSRHAAWQNREPGLHAAGHGADMVMPARQSPPTATNCCARAMTSAPSLPI